MSDTKAPSPSSLARQWGIIPGMRVWVGGHNVKAKRLISRALAGTIHPPSGPIDMAFITPQSADEALYFVRKLRQRLAQGGAIWIIQAHPTARSESGAGPPTPEFDKTLVELGLVATERFPVGDEAVSIRFDLLGR